MSSFLRSSLSSKTWSVSTLPLMSSLTLSVGNSILQSREGLSVSLPSVLSSLSLFHPRSQHPYSLSLSLAQLLEVLLKSYLYLANSSLSGAVPAVAGVTLEGFIEYLTPVMSITCAACNILVSHISLHPY
jgi:hypothetical protein